jgi:hypothetical protein
VEPLTRIRFAVTSPESKQPHDLLVACESAVACCRSSKIRGKSGT